MSETHEHQRIRTPSLADVAAVASVSHQTVSRVLRNHPNVRPQTRSRVLASIEELGYRPNLAARTLASGRSAQIGVITAEPGAYETLSAVESAAYAAGYSVCLAGARSPGLGCLAESMSRLSEQSVAGMIIVAPVASLESALEMMPAGLPTVVVGARPDYHVSAVAADQHRGAYLATRHLLELGHRSVVHITGPRHSAEARERAAGWRSALEEAGAGIPQLISGGWSARAGYEAGQILARALDVTAVLAANDRVALGLLCALNENRRSVPDDISVVGFDDTPDAAFFTPPLTTVRQDVAALGTRSLDLLLSQLTTNTRSTEQITITPELVIRETTASPS